MMAQRAMNLARLSASRVEFDTAKTRIAFGTDHVAFSHGLQLCRRMVTVRRRVRFTKGLSSCVSQPFLREARSMAHLRFVSRMRGLASCKKKFRLMGIS
jgi:hypothetical protein